MALRQQEKGGKRGGLFDDLSPSQLIAGALAAVTSMLLASRIGIAGSVIGVAVGSVVSAVASQLYKKFLVVSAEKLRELRPDEAVVLPETSSGRENLSQQSLSGATMPLRPVLIRRSHTPHIDDEALHDDVTVRRALERRERKRKFQRKIVAVSIFSAIVAVLLSALAVDFFTQGQGLGSHPSPVISLPEQEQSIAGNALDKPFLPNTQTPSAEDEHFGTTGKENASESSDTARNHSDASSRPSDSADSSVDAVPEAKPSSPEVDKGEEGHTESGGADVDADTKPGNSGNDNSSGESLGSENGVDKGATSL